jgi:hypothetical protein
VKYDAKFAPTPEILAAYMDGELDPSLGAAVQSWLAEHPEAQTEIEAQRRLVELFLSTSPSEPREDAWQAALAEIQARLSPHKTIRHSSRRVLRWLSGLAATAALVAVVVFATMRPTPEQRNPNGEGTVSGPPFPVATDDDVAINSIEDSDLDALVVGTLPVRAPLALLNHDEVQVEHVIPDQGMNTRYVGDGPTPMILAEPLDPAPELKAP